MQKLANNSPMFSLALSLSLSQDSQEERERERERESPLQYANHVTHLLRQYLAPLHALDCRLMMMMMMMMMVMVMPFYVLLSIAKSGGRGSTATRLLFLLF